MLVDHDRRRHGAPPPNGTYDAENLSAAGLRAAPIPRRLARRRVPAPAVPVDAGRRRHVAARPHAGRLFWRIYDSAQALLEIGLASLHDFGGWIVAGAVVVIPLWLISRLFATAR